MCSSLQSVRASSLLDSGSAPSTNAASVARQVDGKKPGSSSRQTTCSAVPRRSAIRTPMFRSASSGTARAAGSWSRRGAVVSHSPLSSRVPARASAPAEQERFSYRTRREKASVGQAETDQALAQFDELVEMARNRTPLEEVRRRVAGVPDEYVPEAPELWRFLVDLFEYNPAPALERIRVPVLALFGGADEIVPVEKSVAVYQAAVLPDLLTVAVFPRRRPSRAGRRSAAHGGRISRNALVLRHGVRDSFAPDTVRPGSVPPPMT